MLKGADIVLQCLRAEGVEPVFGYPGGAIMPLYDALEGSGIRHILTRHEQGAVFAAEGYARVTGEVGVAMATSGPGATNLVTGIADAKMDSVPLVCITGQVRSALYDALEGSGIRHILTRHEQGAVFAAEGYARVTAPCSC